MQGKQHSPKAPDFRGTKKAYELFIPWKCEGAEIAGWLAVALSVKEEIEPGDFAIDTGESLSSITGTEMTMHEYEMKILRTTLRKNNNDINLTARKLDIGVSDNVEIAETGKRIR